MWDFNISAIGCESPTVTNPSLTRKCRSSELERALGSDLLLTCTCQSSEPESKNKPEDIISKAPEHKGITFTKLSTIKHDVSHWFAVAKIVSGLGIPWEDDDFHCPMDYNSPENHMENDSTNLNDLFNLEQTPPTTKLLVKLPTQNARLPTWGSDEGPAYDLYSREDMILESGTCKLANTGILIAAPSTRMCARIAPRSGLLVKRLDIGTAVVDSEYRGAIKVLLINNSDTPFQLDTSDRMAQLSLERMENPECNLV